MIMEKESFFRLFKTDKTLRWSMIGILTILVISLVIIGLVTGLWIAGGNDFLIMILLVSLVSVDAGFWLFYAIVFLSSSRGYEKAGRLMAEQLAAFSRNEIHISSEVYRSQAMNRVQGAINDLIEHYEKITGAAQDTQSRPYAYRRLTQQEFLAGWRDELLMNPSPLSALMFARLNGNEAPTPEALTALYEALRKIFPTSMMGDYDDATIVVYFYRIQSVQGFETKLQNFAADFAFAKNMPHQTNMAVYGVDMGGAYFPNVPLSDLFTHALDAIGRASGVNFDLGNPAIGSFSVKAAPNENIARITSLLQGAKLSRQLFEAKGPGEEKKAITDFLSFYMNIADFEEAGLYLYDDARRTYRLDVYSRVGKTAEDEAEIIAAAATEDSDEKAYLGLSALGESVAYEELHPFFELAAKNAPFFTRDILTLPREVSLPCQNLGIVSLFLVPIHFRGEETGLVFLTAKKGLHLTLFQREKLQEMVPNITQAAMQLISTQRVEFVQQRFNSLASRNEQYLYTIDQRTKKLIDTSDSLRRKFPDAMPGAYCYKAIFGLDEPCENCPLAVGTIKRLVPELGVKEASHSVLSLRLGAEGYATLLLEKEADRGTAAAFLDRVLMIKNLKAFSVDLSRTLHGVNNAGSIVAVRLANKDALLERFPGQNASALLAPIVRELQSLGHDDVLYRYDERTLVFFLPSMVSRNDLYGFIEEVALAIHGPLYIGADSFQPKYSYCRLSYPSDINSTSDAISLIHSELARCETLGEGLVAEVGRNRLRKAYRPDYIEALLQEKLKSRRVDMRYYATNDKSNQARRIEAYMTILTEDHFRLKHGEFSKIAREKNLSFPLDLAALRQLGENYTSYRDNVLKDNGIVSFIVSLNPGTILNHDFPDRLRSMLSDYNMPASFLTIDAHAAYLMGHLEGAAASIKELKKLGVKVAAGNYSPLIGEPSKFFRLGLSEVKLAAGFLKDAMSNDSDALTYARVAAAFQKQGIAVSSNGVDTKDELNYILGLGIESYQGEMASPVMDEPEMITFLTQR